MLDFWALAAAFAALTALLLIRPLVTARRAGTSRASHDVAVFRDQLTAVERDLDRGVLSEARCVEIEAHSMTPPYDDPASFKGGVCAATLHNDDYQSPIEAVSNFHRDSEEWSLSWKDQKAILTANFEENTRLMDEMNNGR